ncbi:hypothetical protein CTAYLR_005247 [Chrysophaeum taylorii]|uniref:EF-hand domain-containing protein n=1 Tax=Chrysophaeum taylorii TaxID=2483200 RepID=A0AAD7XJD9_9STRA|nr:hypothetical protein CTAYLR_005247 [Chrysophaeum taylorii]
MVFATALVAFVGRFEVGKRALRATVQEPPPLSSWSSCEPSWRSPASWQPRGPAASENFLFDAQRLRLVVARMRIVATEEELAALMSQIDADDDGIISFSEFVRFVTQSGSDDTLVGRLRRALRDDFETRAAVDEVFVVKPVSASEYLAGLDRAQQPAMAALRSEFDALSRVQHEARILDAGDRYASTYDAKDWLRVLSSWPSSFVVRRIRSPLVAISAWALGVSVVHGAALAKAGVVFGLLGAAAPGVGIAKTMTLAGSALSLLLVFRTNTAYNRYAEGRKVWETMTTAARDCAEFCGAYIEEIGEARVRRVADLLCAFPLALQLHLQNQRVPPEPREDVHKSFLELVNDKFRKNGAFRRCWRCRDAARRPATTEGSVPLAAFIAGCRADERLAASFSLPSDVDAGVALQQLHQLKFGSSREPNRPVSLCELEAYYNPLAIARLLPADLRARLSRSRCAPLEISRLLVREAKAVPYDEDAFTSRERITLLNSIARLRGCVASAERVAQTPVPLHYARHALRFLTLWSVLLPFALVDHLGLLTVPVTAFMVWALYGLREIGTLIENPFSRPLQLQIVSDTLFLDVREAVDTAVHFGSRRSV